VQDSIVHNPPPLRQAPNNNAGEGEITNAVERTLFWIHGETLNPKPYTLKWRGGGAIPTQAWRGRQRRRRLRRPRSETPKPRRSLRASQMPCPSLGRRWPRHARTQRAWSHRRRLWWRGGHGRSQTSRRRRWWRTYAR
jgi:hypothetical protein